MTNRLITAWICNLIDTVATVHLYTQYNGREINPISNFLLKSPPVFVLVKLVTMSIAVLFMWKKQNMRIANFLSWVLFIEYLLVALYYLIVYTFIL